VTVAGAHSSTPGLCTCPARRPLCSEMSRTRGSASGLMARTNSTEMRRRSRASVTSTGGDHSRRLRRDRRRDQDRHDVGRTGRASSNPPIDPAP
jgi:hypothetical protein